MKCGCGNTHDADEVAGRLVDEAVEHQCLVWALQVSVLMRSRTIKRLVGSGVPLKEVQALCNQILEDAK